MTAIWNAIVNWFQSKGGLAHVIAGIYLGAIAAYAAVPAFHQLVTSVNAMLPAWLEQLVLALIGIFAWYKNTQSPMGLRVAIDKSTQKLAVWAMISLLMLGTMTGCSAATVAQDIVNWTPTVVSTANTVSSVVATLDPADALLIKGVTVGFDAAASLLQSQAQTYLADPSATALGQLQAQALAFQQNVNAALLNAARIVDQATQQKVMIAIQGLATALTAILALISTIKGNTLSKQSIVAQHQTSMLMRQVNREMAMAMVASHYRVSQTEASADLDLGYLRLQQAGL